MKHETVAIKFDDLLGRIARDANGDGDTSWRDLLGYWDRSSQLTGTWWAVSWPEHVKTPRYNSDATYAGPSKTAAECEADAIYGG